MNTLIHRSFAAALLVLAPVLSQAAVTSATCSIAVDYALNGALVEPFAHDFVVTEGATYTFDFSTTTRQKALSATLARNGARSVLTIDYFNDVGTFVAVQVDTSVRLVRPGTAAETSGRHVFSTSQGVVGNHQTTWTLQCRGQ